ncbi:hypothetical protein BaOVIS_010740 [Babesia ovis]|uniref:Uncharacterized protein n=1 Tax=Babesia ovis TaxID=5869 RepID=A0A9W5WU72_BABOV|nr:hypothetical protein BaOVIS_010740 [Babesia ovis]
MAVTDDSDASEESSKKRLTTKRKLEMIRSETEISSFIYIGKIIKCVELIGPITLDGCEGNSVFVISSCCSTTDLPPIHDEGLCGSLVMHEAHIQHVCANDSEDIFAYTFTIHRPRLAKITPLKKGVCIGLEWINPLLFGPIATYANSSDLLVVLLMDDGSISLCNINVESSKGHLDVSDIDTTAEDDFPTVLWHYNPQSDVKDQMITCITLSQRNGPFKAPFKDSPNTTTATSPNSENVPSDDTPLVTVVGGTNDGYIHIWHFEWEALCETARNAASDGVSTVSPCFTQTIPIFNDPQEPSPSRRLVAVSFLPCPEPYVLAITTYLGTVIVWDIRNATLEGELSSYQSSHRPLTMAKWTGNQQHLLIGGSCVTTVEWQVKPGMTSVPYDRGPQILYKGVFDNICWSMDTTTNNAYFVYDDGLFVQVPIYAIGRRNPQEIATTYLWEPLSIDGYNQVASARNMLCSGFVAQAQELANRQFKLDLSFIRDKGVCVTRNGGKYRTGKGAKEISGRLMRNKALSHHTVKAKEMSFSDVNFSFTVYGGNTGLLHLIITKT